METDWRSNENASKVTFIWFSTVFRLSREQSSPQRELDCVAQAVRDGVLQEWRSQFRCSTGRLEAWHDRDYAITLSEAPSRARTK